MTIHPIASTGIPNISDARRFAGFGFVFAALRWAVRGPPGARRTRVRSAAVLASVVFCLGPQPQTLAKTQAKRDGAGGCSRASGHDQSLPLEWPLAPPIELSKATEQVGFFGAELVVREDALAM